MKKKNEDIFDETFNDDLIDEGEIIIEEEVLGEESHKDKIKSLREKLKACEAEKKEYLDGWQRAKADTINSKKEWEASRSGLMNLGSEAVVEDLLPVLDSFEMAFKNKEKWEAVDENWRTGVEYIYNQLIESL